MSLLLVHPVCVLISTEILPFLYAAIYKKNFTFLAVVYHVVILAASMHVEWN